jgi:hypothetical protein
MTKVRLVYVPAFVALAVFLTYGTLAQTAASVKPVAAQVKSAAAAHGMPAIEKVKVNAPVTLTDNGDTWTLDNGIVKASIRKRDGNLTSLVYHGVEILTKGNYSYWEQRPAGTVTARVTVDPATNGGERAEVSVLGVNPGGGAGGGFARGGGAPGAAGSAAGVPGAGGPGAGAAVARLVLRVRALLVLPGAGVVVVAEVWTLRRAIPWSEASAASTLTANTPIMLLIRRLARAKADSSCRT